MGDEGEGLLGYLMRREPRTYYTGMWVVKGSNDNYRIIWVKDITHQQ